jgi:UDP-glucose 4-epimerase
MNILITGGAGYIGTELVYALEKEEKINEIVIYDNFARSNYNLFLGHAKLNTDKIRFVNGNLLDSRKLKKEVDRADIVFHLAAKVSTPFANHNPHEFDQINNWGTAELTYLIEKSNVKKFIYTSSVSVYGASKKEISMDTIVNPVSFYGIAKMHGEKHVRRLQNSGIQTYILRLGNVYGYSKSMRFDSVINKFMFEANFTNKIRIYGSGNQKRTFIHIDRLTSTLKNVATSSDLAPDTYNLVESVFSINEVVDELRELYPELEMTFVNQEVKMRSLKVNIDERITNSASSAKLNLAQDLAEFKNHFSF